MDNVVRFWARAVEAAAAAAGVEAEPAINKALAATPPRMSSVLYPKTVPSKRLQPAKV